VDLYVYKVENGKVSVSKLMSRRNRVLVVDRKTRILVRKTGNSFFLDLSRLKLDVGIGIKFAQSLGTIRWDRKSRHLTSTHFGHVTPLKEGFVLAYIGSSKKIILVLSQTMEGVRRIAEQHLRV